VVGAGNLRIRALVRPLLRGATLRPNDGCVAKGLVPAASLGARVGSAIALLLQSLWGKTQEGNRIKWCGAGAAGACPCLGCVVQRAQAR